MSDRVFHVHHEGAPYYYVQGRSFYDVRAHVRKTHPMIEDDAFTSVNAAPSYCKVESAPAMLTQQELAQEHARSIASRAYEEALDDVREMLRAPFSDMGVSGVSKLSTASVVAHLKDRVEDLRRNRRK